MVQMLIKLMQDDVADWTIVELQGDLECKNSEEPLNGKFIGDLHFTKKGVPIFIIGHHVLYGKITHLDKPIAVLLKNRTATESRSAMETDDPEICSESSSGDVVNYTVKAVVRKKIVFRTRPKPIVTSVLKKV